MNMMISYQELVRTFPNLRSIKLTCYSAGQFILQTLPLSYLLRARCRSWASSAELEAEVSSINTTRVMAVGKFVT
ncbi:hypothetical protein, partial [Klebsiella pneumoniae]|uniref:hypothetical protein n=1 Tax=Klebsiella pneumoniae TaxID=573 RepID=UPI001E5D752D